MKRILSLLLLIALSCGCGTLSYNTTYGKYSRYLDGYWGQWEPFFATETFEFQGEPENFVVHKAENHPSNYCFRLKVKDLDPAAVKRNAPATFTGTIEFFAYQPASARKASDIFVRRSLGFLDGKVVGSETHMTRPAKIEMQKVSDGYLYTVYIDDVGFSIVVPWKRLGTK